MKVYPSILGADFGHLQADVDTVTPHGDALHIDVMDGHLVPNLTFGAPILRCLHTNLPLDVHLMVINPDDRFQEFIDAGADRIAFHIEADGDVFDNIEILRQHAISPGLAIDHDTPVEAIIPYIHLPDYIIVMTIRAGFSGQAFIEEDLEKVNIIKKFRPDIEVMVDGGVDDLTAKKCFSAGADSLAVASYLFGHRDIVDRIHRLKSIS